jgi:hypothetical protein
MDPGPVYTDDIAVAEALEAKTAADEVYKEARAAAKAAEMAKARANEILNEASKAREAAAAAQGEAAYRAVKVGREARKRGASAAVKQTLNDALADEKATIEAYHTATAAVKAAAAERNRLHYAEVAADERWTQAYRTSSDADSKYRRAVYQRERAIASGNKVEDPVSQPQPEGNGRDPSGGGRKARRKTRRNRRNKRRTNKKTGSSTKN